MHKKLITACLAIAAFAAFAIMPAGASASPELGETTFVEGSHIWDKVVAPKKIRAHLVGASRMTDSSGGTLVECSVGTMTGELTENSGTSIKGDISSATFSNAGGAPCESSFGSTTTITTAFSSGGVAQGVPWCVSTIKGTDTFEVRGGNCTEGARNLKFILDSSLLGECEYSRASVTGTFTTDNVAGTTTDAVLTVTKGGPFSRIRGSFFCPSEGFLDMSFTLETDQTANTEPLYIR